MGRVWFSPGVAGIGCASLLADVGHEVPTALLPSLLTGRRRAIAVGGYTATAFLSSVTGAASSVWQVGMLRAGAWAARRLRVPARNALLADIVDPAVYGRAYGFERAMDNLGAIGGPVLAIVLVGLVGTRAAIGLSVIPGLLATVAILYAIRHTAAPKARERTGIRFQVRPVLQGRLKSLFAGISAFEFGNCAATLLILRATELLEPGRSPPSAATAALWSTSRTTPPQRSPASPPGGTPTAPPPDGPSPWG